MARIAGVDLPRNKRIEIGLTYIYGIGKTTSRKILDKLNIDPDIKTDQLSDEEISNIRKAIDSEYKVEGELRTSISRASPSKVATGSRPANQYKRPHP